MTTANGSGRRSEVRGLPRDARGPIASRPRLGQFAGLPAPGHTVFVCSGSGCGTGAIAVRLARLGLHVTLLDASVPMLDFAERAAREAGVTQRVALKHGDAAQVANLFPAGSFDVIICHNLLEYFDDPCAVFRSAARALRDPSSIISVVVRNQAGEVL